MAHFLWHHREISRRFMGRQFRFVESLAHAY